MIPASGAGGRGFDSPLAPLLHVWGISSIGRVRRSQRRGTGIETRILHFTTISTVGLVGYDARLTRERSPVRSRDGVLGRIAQMVERWSNKPSVVGSSPTMTIFYSRVL